MIQIPSSAEIRRAAERRREEFARVMAEIFQESQALSRRSRQPEGLRIANERRRAQAIARREAAGLPTTRTPGGRFTRARLTPEARVARRRELLTRNTAFRAISDVISRDVSETVPRTRRTRVVESQNYPGVKEYYISVSNNSQI